LSIAQLYDKDNHVCFDDYQCAIEDTKTNDIIPCGFRLDNAYAMSLDHISTMHLLHLKASLDDA